MSAPGATVGERSLPSARRATTPARRSRRPGLLRLIGLTVVLAFFLFPIIYLVSVSFKPQPEVLSGQFLPSRIAWENWPDAFRSVEVLLFMRNSAIVAAASTLVTLLLTVPATYAMVRYEVGGKGLYTVVLSSYVAPPIVRVCCRSFTSCGVWN